MTVHRILIADDDQELSDALARRCRQMGIGVDVASTARQALAQLELRPPELAILDVDMPEGSGLAVCEMVMHNPRLKHMPVVILTGSKDPLTVQRCHQLRAFYVTKCADVWPRIRPLLEDLLEMRPVGPNQPGPATAGDTLWAGSTVAATTSELGSVVEPAAAPMVQHIPLPSVQNARLSGSAPPKATPNGTTSPASRSLHQLMDAVFDSLGADDSNSDSDGVVAQLRPAEPPWVLSIDDDESFSFALQLRLQEHGVAVQRAFDGREGYRSAFHGHAQAIILDYNMPEGNADYVLRRLKESPVTRNIPVIVLTGNRDRHVERQMYAMGAAYFMNKPYDWDVLWREVSRHLTFPECDAPAKRDDCSALQSSTC